MTVRKRYHYPWHHSTFTSGKIGDLVPIFRAEVTPGDTFKGSLGLLSRFWPAETPLLNSMYMSSWFFFVPYRTIWAQWEDYAVQMALEGKSSHVVPTTAPTGWLFQNVVAQHPVSELPLRAYNHIWNNWFRDVDWDPNKVGINDHSLKGVAHHKNTFTTVRSYKSDDTKVTLNPVTLTSEDNSTDIGTRAFDNADSSFTFDMDQFHTREDLYHERKKGKFFGDDYHNVMRRMGGMVRRSDDDTPELLCQYHRRVSNHDIVSTGAEADLGKYKGYHIGAKRDRFPPRVFREHGIILGLAAVRFEPVTRHFTPFEDISPYEESWIHESYPYGNRWFGQSTTQDMPLFISQVASGDATAPGTILGTVEPHQNLRKPQDLVAYNSDTAAIWKAWLPSLPDLDPNKTEPEYSVKNWIYANQKSYVDTITDEIFPGATWHFLLKTSSRLSKISQIPPFVKEVDRKH